MKRLHLSPQAREYPESGSKKDTLREGSSLSCLHLFLLLHHSPQVLLPLELLTLGV